MGFDGPLSAQEQMFILYEIKLQCYQNLSSIESAGKTKPYLLIHSIILYLRELHLSAYETIYF